MIGVRKFMKKIKVKFIQNDTGKVLELELMSHFTCILGIDSGEGKSWFYDYIADNLPTGQVKIESELPVVVANNTNLFDYFEVPTRSIIFIDEWVLTKFSSQFKIINESQHLFLCITRSFPFKTSSPLDGIYQITDDTDGWFKCNKLNDNNDLPLADKNFKFDYIVTEAQRDRSENEFLNAWSENSSIEVIGCNGKDRVAKVLKMLEKKYGHPSVLVLTDLFSISGQYSLLRKRCRDNPNIRFYDYGSFEEMLFNSEFLSANTELNPLDFITLERFYETALEQFTSGTPYEYKHGNPLSKCYLKQCENCTCIKICKQKFRQIVGSSSCLLRCCEFENNYAAPINAFK